MMGPGMFDGLVEGVLFVGIVAGVLLCLIAYGLLKLASHITLGWIP